jgi:nucleoside-diphosphate kinase
MAGRITFTIVKPEAVAKEYTGHIFSMISSAGFHIASMKMIRMTREMAEKFYLVHKERPFYKDLVEFMSSGPVVVAVLEKDNAVIDYRTLIGATDPSKAAEGTIRKKYAESIQNNAVHGSDSNENAAIECDFFFAKNERFYLKGE